MDNCLNYATVLLLASVTGVWSACADLDPVSCVTLLQQNPSLCNEEVFAHTACARTCGKCAVTCYHCDNPVTSFQQCTNTRACQLGEKCMLTTLSSTHDGHAEYRMLCATDDMCDGTSIFLGRRDISTHCCTGDLCNRGPTTTTAAPTTTTTPAPTTIPICARDVIVFVEDSRNTTSPTYFKQMLSDLVSSMSIGPTDNQFEIALFDSGIHSKVDFQRNQNATWLLDKIQHLNFNHRTDSVDYNDVVNKLGDFLDPRHRKDNRLGVPDVVIIVSDHAHMGDAITDIKNHHNNIDIFTATRNIIVVNVGPDATNYSPFSQIATSTDFVINVNDYPDLLAINSALLSLICR